MRIVTLSVSLFFVPLSQCALYVFLCPSFRLSFSAGFSHYVCWIALSIWLLLVPADHYTQSSWIPAHQTFDSDTCGSPEIAGLSYRFRGWPRYRHPSCCLSQENPGWNQVLLSIGPTHILHTQRPFQDSTPAPTTTPPPTPNHNQCHTDIPLPCSWCGPTRPWPRNDIKEIFLFRVLLYSPPPQPTKQAGYSGLGNPCRWPTDMLVAIEDRSAQSDSIVLFQ